MLAAFTSRQACKTGMQFSDSKCSAKHGCSLSVIFGAPRNATRMPAQKATHKYIGCLGTGLGTLAIGLKGKLAKVSVMVPLRAHVHYLRFCWHRLGRDCLGSHLNSVYHCTGWLYLPRLQVGLFKASFTLQGERKHREYRPSNHCWENMLSTRPRDRPPFDLISPLESAEVGSSGYRFTG